MLQFVEPLVRSAYVTAQQAMRLSCSLLTVRLVRGTRRDCRACVPSSQRVETQAWCKPHAWTQHACLPRRWGFGGQRACVLVEDAEARCMGAWADWEGLQSLRAALDWRGERESALRAELSKVCALSAPHTDSWLPSHRSTSARVHHQAQVPAAGLVQSLPWAGVCAGLQRLAWWFWGPHRCCLQADVRPVGFGKPASKQDGELTSFVCRLRMP